MLRSPEPDNARIERPNGPDGNVSEKVWGK
jgi:hypothetical protein